MRVVITSCSKISAAVVVTHAVINIYVNFTMVLHNAGRRAPARLDIVRHSEPRTWIVNYIILCAHMAGARCTLSNLANKL